jgi:hypothetical protein
MRLTKDVLTFSLQPVEVPSKEPWYEICIGKRIQRENASKGWLPSPEKSTAISKGHNIRSFPLTSGLLSDVEISITESTPNALLEHMRRKEWSAEDVLRAFCKRTGITHGLVCISRPILKSYLRFDVLLNLHAEHDRPIQ